MVTKTDVRIHPNRLGPDEAGEIISVNSQRAGWRYISFGVHALRAGDRLSAETGDDETALVVLGGLCDVESTAGTWKAVGRRRHVFDGLPCALYLPRRTAYALRATTPLEVAVCSARAERNFPARLIQPRDVAIEIRGGKNVTRQIYHVVKPEFPAHRLLIGETDGLPLQRRIQDHLLRGSWRICDSQSLLKRPKIPRCLVSTSS
jgi:5-deoxy-glucuronate isomerase